MPSALAVFRLIAGPMRSGMMSQLGQTEKYSARADVFRSSSDNGRGFSARKGRYADRRSWRLQPCFADPSLWNIDLPWSGSLSPLWYENPHRSACPLSNLRGLKIFYLPA